MPINTIIIIYIYAKNVNNYAYILYQCTILQTIYSNFDGSFG